MDLQLQQRFALQGAAAALETTVKRTQTRLDELKSRAEQYSETTFVVFDAADKVVPRIWIGGEDGSALMDLTASEARRYLMKRQKRYEFEAQQISERLQALNQELDSIKAQLG